jgi:hypothetical protein
MTANNGDGKVSRGYGAAGDFGGKGRCTNDVEGSDAKEFFGVEYFLGFKDFGDNRDCAVYRVGDDEDKGIGTMCCDALGEVTDDAGIDLEQVCKKS